MKTISRRLQSVDGDSPLARYVREAVLVYVRQKASLGGIALDAVLRQHADALAPVVLAAVDDLARGGVIAIDVSACGAVVVVWRGLAEAAA